ncbi:MFS transporter [Streptomyces sp. NPDC059080]|uniref:MFS transporter n=1 Tax=Streptomyces sp. NPDC059080 TaxID=3346718 RepID=UPI00369CA2D7
MRPQPPDPGSAAPEHTTTARPGAAGGSLRPAVHRWRLLTALLAAQFMANIDTAIANIAAPAIQSDLGASGGEAGLVVSGYVVAYAVLLVAGARLGGSRGHRRIFLAGMALFTAASLACALAFDPATLIASRIAQGAGAALMVPQVLSGIQLYFTGRQRIKALGYYAIALSGGAVAGQALGGVLIAADILGTGWRPIFLINVPAGLLLLWAAVRVMPADAGEGGASAGTWAAGSGAAAAAASRPGPSAPEYVRPEAVGPGPARPESARPEPAFLETIPDAAGGPLSSGPGPGAGNPESAHSGPACQEAASGPAKDAFPSGSGSGSGSGPGSGSGSGSGPAPRPGTTTIVTVPDDVDVHGMALLATTVLLLIVPLLLGTDAGWPWWMWVCLAAAVPMGAAFRRSQRRRAARGGRPLIAEEVVREPAIRWSLAAHGATTMTYFALLFVLAVYLQEGLGRGPAYAGMAMISWVAAFGLAGPLLARVPSRYAVVMPAVGCTVLAGGYAAVWLYLVTGHRTGPPLFLLLGIGGLGLGISSNSLIARMTFVLPDRYAADLSGVISTNAQLCGALGVATLGGGYLHLTDGGSASATASAHALQAVLATSAVLAVLSALASQRGGRTRPTEAEPTTPVALTTTVTTTTTTRPERGDP